MMRFDPEVLKRVDEAAKRRGVSRSAWIQFTVSRALDRGKGRTWFGSSLGKGSEAPSPTLMD